MNLKRCRRIASLAQLALAHSAARPIRALPAVSTKPLQRGIVYPTVAIASPSERSQIVLLATWWKAAVKTTCSVFFFFFKAKIVSPNIADKLVKWYFKTKTSEISSSSHFAEWATVLRLGSKQTVWNLSNPKEERAQVSSERLDSRFKCLTVFLFPSDPFHVSQWHTKHWVLN